MPKGPATTTADDVTDTIRSLVDRVADAKFTQEMARRGQEMAAEFGDRASETWRDSRPMRRDAAKAIERTGRDVRKQLRPLLKDLWKRRTMAIGAAGAAVPVGRELVDTAAERLGFQRREQRHWGAFFLGLILGAMGGAIVAMLTTPKRGSEMRRELGTRADDVRREVTERARDAEWVPIFERQSTGNGHAVAEPSLTDATQADPTGNVQAAATEGSDVTAASAASGTAAETSAAEATDAINDAYDGVERESTT